MIDITETPIGYQVEFEYKPWIVDAVKRIPGAHFKQLDGKKFWHVPLSSSNALLNWAAKLGKTPKAQTAVEIGEIDPLPELTIDIPLKMKMFPYQESGVAYNLEKKTAILGDQPGLGKTIQAIATAEASGCKCILIICPATLKENWKREIEVKWTNSKALILSDSCKNTWPTFYKVGIVKYFITNYESLKKYFVEGVNIPTGKDGKPVPLRLNHIKFKDTIDLFDCVIIDEIHKCFPYETKVSTEIGLLEIGLIVEQKLDIKVASFDHKSNSIVFKKIINHWTNELKERSIYKIRHENGLLYATGNHKIYTASGEYKEVHKIKSGEMLYMLQENLSDKKGRKGNCKILLQELLCKDNKCRSGNKEENGLEQKKAGNRKNMCLLLSKFFYKIQRQGICKNSVLQSKLLGKMESKNTGGYCCKSNAGEKGKSKSECTSYNERRFKKAKNFTKNDCKKSYAQSGNNRKAKKGNEWSHISGKGWQWPINKAANNALGGNRATGISNGVCYTNKDREEFIQKPTKFIQGRCCNRKYKACNRSGREYPQIKKMEISGRKKNRSVKCVRVESIEVYKPTSNGEFGFSSIVNKRVYDLEVADTHNYFADNILVSNCKDGKTMQSKLTMGIAKGKEYILGLTGTPVVNKPIDLIPQLHIIGRLHNFGGYKGFVDRYCQGRNQASNLKELNYLLHKNCFYRREKKDVLKDLPDKMREIIKCTISNQREYDKAENNLVNYLKENLGKTDQEISVSLRGEVMVMIGILKKIAAKGKIADVIEHIEEVVEAGEKIIVFAWHKEVIDELKKVITGAVTVVGNDSMESRQRSVDSFQNDPKVQVILCNIKSGGVGITLTASSRVAFIELPWHPADCEQCEDRAHRIGQKDSVQVSYFLGDGTIDEKIYEIIENKRNIVNQVTGASDDVETVEKNMVDQLIGIFSKAKN